MARFISVDTVVDFLYSLYHNTNTSGVPFAPVYAVKEHCDIKKGEELNASLGTDKYEKDEEYIPGRDFTNLMSRIFPYTQNEQLTS